jgi:diguanylate cyclase (GGDEF)-like protein
MDIDAFKEINDAFGHDVGDLIMQTMSSRLMVQKGENGSLSRLGGDEFGFVVTGMDDNQAVHFFNEILEVIRGPVVLVGRCAAARRVSGSPDIPIMGTHCRRCSRQRIWHFTMRSIWAGTA